jgi:hypothetical protein
MSMTNLMISSRLDKCDGIWMTNEFSSQNIFSDVSVAYCDKREWSSMWDSLLVLNRTCRHV